MKPALPDYLMRGQARDGKLLGKEEKAAVVQIQALARGGLDRRRVRSLRSQHTPQHTHTAAAVHTKATPPSVVTWLVLRPAGAVKTLFRGLLRGLLRLYSGALLRLVLR